MTIALSVPTSHLKGCYLLVALGVCWGPIPPLMQIVDRSGLETLSIAAWIAAISAVGLTILALLKGDYPALGLTNTLRFLVVGFLGTALPYIVLLYVAPFIPAMVIAILLAAESFFVFMIATAIGLEAPTVRRFLGLGFGLLSVVIALSPSLHEVSVLMWPFVAISLVAPMGYAIEEIFIARMPQFDASALGTATGISTAAAVILLPIAFVFGTSPFALQLDLALLLPISLIALTSAASTVLIVLVVRLKGAVFAGQSCYFMTGGSILWSFLLLGEQLTWWIAIALLFLALGVKLVTPMER